MITNEISQFIIDHIDDDNKNQISIDLFLDLATYSKAELISAFLLLEKIGLLEKTTKHNFVLVKKVKPLTIAAIMQHGLDISTIENFFEISQKDKELADNIMSNYVEIKTTNLLPQLITQKRCFVFNQPNDDVGISLFYLYEATNATLIEYIKKLSINDEYLKTLLEMHENAENCLIDYTKK